MKGMKKGDMKSHAPSHPATVKGGKANMADVKSTVKSCMSYSKSYGSVGGKMKPQK